MNWMEEYIQINLLYELVDEYKERLKQLKQI